MARLIDIVGKKACSGTDQPNTGKLGCTVEMKTPESLLRLPKNFKILNTVDINLEWVKSLIKSGKLTPITEASAFEETSSEDSFNTNTKGEKRLNVSGLPEYKLMFEEGHEFYKQLFKFKSYKSHDFIIIDDEGNWAIAKDSTGNFKGFSAGHVTPEMRKTKVQGGDSEMKSLILQFINRKEWDYNYEVIPQENIGFYPEDIPTVNGVAFIFEDQPSSLNQEFLIKAVLKSDMNTPVEGLSLNDFKITLNGQNVVISDITDEPEAGLYEISLDLNLTVGVDYEIDLYDSTVGSESNVIEVEGVLYRSDSKVFQAI